MNGLYMVGYELQEPEPLFREVQQAVIDQTSAQMAWSKAQGPDVTTIYESHIPSVGSTVIFFNYRSDYPAKDIASRYYGHVYGTVLLLNNTVALQSEIIEQVSSFGRLVPIQDISQHFEPREENGLINRIAFRNPQYEPNVQTQF